MTKTIPVKHGIALVALFVLGNAPIFPLGERAGNDLWLAFLLAIALAVPLVIVYGRLCIILEGASLWEGLIKLGGPWFARFVALLYGFYGWRLACLISQDLVEFLTALPLQTTPQTVLVFVLAVLGIWLVKLGPEVLARCGVVLLLVVGLNIVFTFLLILAEVDLQNFLPILNNGFAPVAEGALQMLDFPLLELVIFLWFFDTLDERKSASKILIIGFLFSAIGLMIINCTSLAVLGPETYAGSYFPGHIAVGRIDIAHFLSRLEIISGVMITLSSFIKLAVCLLVACKGFSRVLGFKEYGFLATPLILAIIPGSQWFTKSLLEIDRTRAAVWCPFGIGVQVILPVLIWLWAEIKGALQKRAGP